METSASKCEPKKLETSFKFQNKMTGDVFGTGKPMPLKPSTDKVSGKIGKK